MQIYSDFMKEERPKYLGALSKIANECSKEMLIPSARSLNSLQEKVL